MMQLHLLFRRFEQHQRIVWNKDKGAVQDRTIYEDTIFARMLHEAGFIDRRDYETYAGHFNVMKRFLVYPDALIYLRVSPKSPCNGSKNAAVMRRAGSPSSTWKSFIRDTRVSSLRWTITPASSRSIGTSIRNPKRLPSE